MYKYIFEEESIEESTKYFLQRNLNIEFGID